MKLLSLHLCFLALVQLCLGASKETANVTLPGGEQLTLVSRNLGPNKERKTTPAEYTVFEGKLYNSQFTIPQIILQSGIITIEGKKIELDVSGLAEPWLDGAKEGERLRARFVHLDKKGADLDVLTLTVVFAKGGALDYQVQWTLFGGKSLRTSIANCGDTYPDWVKPEQR